MTFFLGRREYCTTYVDDRFIHAFVHQGHPTKKKAYLRASLRTTRTKQTAPGKYLGTILCEYRWPNGPCRHGTTLALSGTALRGTSTTRH
jgi:hypothetical protein